jgi:hypothetical protein
MFKEYLLKRSLYIIYVQINSRERKARWCIRNSTKYGTESLGRDVFSVVSRPSTEPTFPGNQREQGLISLAVKRPKVQLPNSFLPTDIWNICHCHSHSQWVTPPTSAGKYGDPHVKYPILATNWMSQQNLASFRAQNLMKVLKSGTIRRSRRAEMRM